MQNSRNLHQFSKVPCTHRHNCQNSRNSHICANYAKFAKHFPIRTTENGTLKFYSKLCKICSICPLSLQITQNSRNLRQFPKSQNLQQIVQNLLNLPTLNANQVKFAQSASIFQSSLYPQAQLPKFVQFALLRKLCKICQAFSDSDHGKWNSQILQQIAQNLLNLPTFNASHAKFASSVPIPIYSKSHKICAICPPSLQIT